MNEYGVILFHTTSAALRAEKTAQRAGLAVKLIPTPREFSSDCGLALRFAWADWAAMQTTLAEARVVVADVRPLAARA